MYTFNLSNVINAIITISLYFTVASLGSFTRDLYNSVTKKDEKIRIKRILVGSIFTTFIMIGLEGYILEHYSINILIFIGYIFGGVGFDLFGKWVDIDKIEHVVFDWFIDRLL